MKPIVPEIVRSKVAAFVSLYRRNEMFRRHQERIGTEMAARVAAERDARIKEEFIAILGHDLRNPLNAIALTAHRHGDASAPELCRNASNRILVSAGRMQRLSSDTVDFARSRLGGGIPITRKRREPDNRYLPVHIP